MFKTREEWLCAAVEELRPLFSVFSKPVPTKIRVATGFPYGAERSKAIGQCWSDTNSADGAVEILISPTLGDAIEVFEVLVHELCHATAGAMNHGVNFQSIAGQMHLTPVGTGKETWKSTKGDGDFEGNYRAIIDSLGDYPHAALSHSTKKVQGTRMLKAVCGCGYTIRLTKKWADQGLPTCICGGSFNI